MSATVERTMHPASHDAPEGGPGVERGSATGVAITFLVVSTLMIATAYASAFLPDGAPRWAPWLLATGVPLALVGVMVLGAARSGRLPRSLAIAFGVVGAMLAGGFALALALPADLGAAEPLILGLPRRAAIIVYGVGLLPVFVLPAAYALTFDAQTLREDDLALVRRLAAAHRVRHGSEA